MPDSHHSPASETGRLRPSPAGHKRKFSSSFCPRYSGRSSDVVGTWSGRGVHRVEGCCAARRYGDNAKAERQRPCHVEDCRSKSGSSRWAAYFSHLMAYDEKRPQNHRLWSDHGWFSLHAFSRYQSRSHSKHLSLAGGKRSAGKDRRMDNGNRRNRLCAVIYPPKSRIATGDATKGEFASRLPRKRDRDDP
jgi:hypothetical protein